MPWTEFDFIVHGRFCPQKQIFDAVEELRRSLETPYILLLPFRRNALLESLMHLALEPGAESDAVLTTIRSYTSQNQNAMDRGLMRLQEASLEALKEALAAEPFRQLGDKVTGSWPPLIYPQDGWLSTDTTDTTSDPLRSPIHLVIFTASGRTPDPESLSRITSMIAASIPVSFDHWHAQQALIGPKSTPAIRPDTVSVLDVSAVLGEQGLQDQYLRQLLEVAVAQTSSSYGSIHVVQPAPDNYGTPGLRMVAYCHKGERAQVPDATSPSSSNSLFTGSVLGWVFRHSRELIINDFDQFSDVFPDVCYRRPATLDNDSISELAVPIRYYGFASSSYHSFGIINLEKQHECHPLLREYRRSDVSLVKRIANLIAFWRSSLIASLAARSATKIRDRLPVEPMEISPDMTAGSTDFPIPIEFERQRLRDLVRDQLEDLLRLTHSSSVSLRLIALTRDLSTLVPYEEASAGKKWTHAPIDLGEFKSSVNAWVAKTQGPCYIPDVDDLVAINDEFAPLKEIKRHPERLTKSEVCFPVFVSSRLVGTLNLEHLREDAYSETYHYIAAIASSVGRILADGRELPLSEFMRQVQTLGVSRHNIGKALGKINELLFMGNPTVETSELDAVKSILEGVYNGGIWKPITDGVNNLFDLMHRLFRDKGMLAVPTDPWEFDEDTPLYAIDRGLQTVQLIPSASSIQYVALNLALYDLVSNMSQAMGTGAAGDVRAVLCVKLDVPPRIDPDISPTEVLIRCKNSVFSRSHRALPDDALRRMFREPVLSTDPHTQRAGMGTFLAAMQMRKIGGDIFVSHYRRCPTTGLLDEFEATVVLPTRVFGGLNEPC